MCNYRTWYEWTYTFYKPSSLKVIHNVQKETSNQILSADMNNLLNLLFKQLTYILDRYTYPYHTKYNTCEFNHFDMIIIIN